MRRTIPEAAAKGAPPLLLSIIAIAQQMPMQAGDRK
jgi:hypothetical protein